jgi:hypothetical protein
MPRFVPNQTTSTRMQQNPDASDRRHPPEITTPKPDKSQFGNFQLGSGRHGVPVVPISSGASKENYVRQDVRRLT